MQIYQKAEQIFNLKRFQVAVLGFSEPGQVSKGINKVSFPPKCKGAAEDLVKGLCKKDPSERLPMKKGGVNNIKKSGC